MLLSLGCDDRIWTMSRNISYSRVKRGWLMLISSSRQTWLSSLFWGPHFWMGDIGGGGVDKVWTFSIRNFVLFIDEESRNWVSRLLSQFTLANTQRPRFINDSLVSSDIEDTHISWADHQGKLRVMEVIDKIVSSPSHTPPAHLWNEADCIEGHDGHARREERKNAKFYRGHLDKNTWPIKNVHKKLIKYLLIVFWSEP